MRMVSPALIAVTLVGISTSIADATPLAPGAEVTPSAERTLPAGSYFVGPSTEPVTGVNALGHVWFSGTLTFAVYRESATGFLDFLYQYHASTSQGRVQHLSTIDFGKFSADVTYLKTKLAPSGFVPGTFAPIDAARSTRHGSVISFDFLSPNSIRAGRTTQVLVIHTNATGVVPGATGLIDGRVATVPTLAPRGSPEPATLTLFGGGLLALAGSIVWRRRSSPVAA
jgi:hypothetical protein